MALDPKILASLTRRVEPTDYLRCTPRARRPTPLGMGFGETRFASPTKAFTLLYIAEDLATSAAEAIIRDHFEGKTVRELAQADITDCGVCAMSARRPLRLLSLRRRLLQARHLARHRRRQGARRGARLSQALYDTTDLDGIVYHSRLRKKNCMAIYDRAVAPALTAEPVIQIERLAALVPALKTLKTALI